MEVEAENLKDVILELVETVNLLKYPKRLGILFYLAENPWSSQSDLCFKSPYGPHNSGSIKHHVDLLIDRNLVKREDHKYSLDELGMIVYYFIQQYSKFLKPKEQSHSTQ